LHAGQDALLAGNAGLAAIRLRALLKQFGLRADALRLLVEAEMQMGHVSIAVRLLNWTARITPESAVIRADLAEALIAAGDAIHAITQFREAVDRRPEWWTYHARLAHLYAGRGDGNAANLHTRNARQLAWAEEKLQLAWERSTCYGVSAICSGGSGADQKPNCAM
jgi:Flp pilus assembly protein TadD